MAARARSQSSRRKGPLVRGEPVVRQIMTAVLEELGGVGYAALRVEDVALRAEVNKTTVYRRWPTKESLVRAALSSIAASHGMTKLPDTGSVRGDLVASARRFAGFVSSPIGQSLIRMMVAEPPHSELMAIAHSMRDAHEQGPNAILARARDRGELRPGVDPRLVADILMATWERFVSRPGGIDLELLERIFDVVLDGALAPRKVRGRR
jgi:AcrR family transcriptional regulator